MNTHGVVGQIARIREAANLLIERELKARQMEGIVPAHGALLGFLFAQSEPVPIKALVEHVGRVKSTVTGMLNTLKRYGYIRRFQSTEDQRVVYISLTEKGRSLQHDFEAISGLLLAQVYGNMPQEDRKKLVQSLAALERNLQNGTQPS